MQNILVQYSFPPLLPAATSRVSMTSASKVPVVSHAPVLCSRAETRVELVHADLGGGASSFRASVMRLGRMRSNCFNK